MEYQERSRLGQRLVLARELPLEVAEPLRVGRGGRLFGATAELRPSSAQHGLPPLVQRRLVLAECVENDIDAAVAVLNVSSMDVNSEQKAEGVGHDMALATLNLLGAIIPEDPPFLRS